MSNIPYNKLTKEDKLNIISTYYDTKFNQYSFKRMANLCNVSNRAFSRVLVESGINTKLKNRYIIKNEDYFKNINNENKAYFLGLLFADGYIGNENQIILTLKDKGNTRDILNKFIFDLESNIKIDTVKPSCGYKTTNNFLKISFSNKTINTSLKNLGLGNHKETSRYFIPDEIIKNNLQSHFIRGLYDGDGSLSIKNKHMITPQRTISFLGGNNLLLQIKQIFIDELGVNDNKIRKSPNSDKISELRFSGNKQVERIKEYLYKNSHIYLDFKKF